MNTTTVNTHSFLAGGGEMGERTRSYDWATTALGTPDQWPLPLRTAVGILLNAPFPMFLWWGNDLIQFYNDAYRPSLGNDGKHPAALGQPGPDCWPEIWASLKPLIDQVMSGGEAIRREDQLVPIYRNGRLEDVYWTFGYSAVPDEAGKPAGVLVICTETTAAVTNRRKVEASEQQLRYLTDTVPAIIWTTEPDGYCTYLNKQWYEYTGQTPAEAEGFGWLDATHPDDKTEVGHLFVEANERQIPFSALYRLRQKVGSYRWSIDQGSPRFSATGAYEGMIGTVVDVHDQKSAEEESRKSEERFQAAVVAVGGILWTNNAIGQMEGPQPGWASLTGQTYEAYQGYGWSEAIHPDDVQPTINAWQEAVKNRRTFVIEHRVRQHDGQWGLFSVRAIPLLKADGSVREWVGVHIDVTEQRRAVQALKASEYFSSNLFHSSPVANLVLIGQEMTIRTINEGMLMMLGRDTTIIGKPFLAAVPELIPTPLMDRLRHVLATGEPYHQPEERIELVRHGQPHTGYYNYIYTALSDAAGERNGVIITAIEVTEQVLARRKVEESEARFRALSDELEVLVQQRTQELLASVQDLKRSNSNLQQFAYIASHDLQEPLRKIQSFGDLLKNQYADQLGDGIDHLKRMQSAASRMSVLIRDLLTFSRISTQQDTTAPVSLNDVMQTVLSDLEVAIQETGAQVTVDVLPTIPGDKSQLGQLVQNLLSNALKFRRPDATSVITVRTRRMAVTDLPPSVKPARLVDTYHCIEVTDNGIGFDEKYVDRIFQVFQRLHGRSEFAGTGIGLAICEKVAANHGGAITATSRPGQGATFSVYLPG